MSGFEVEGYIFTTTLVISFLIKAAKWIVEDSIWLVIQLKKLRATIRSELPVEPHPSLGETRSRRELD
jgi:hypothetical protein